MCTRIWLALLLVVSPPLAWSDDALRVTRSIEAVLAGDDARARWQLRFAGDGAIAPLRTAHASARGPARDRLQAVLRSLLLDDPRETDADLAHLAGMTALTALRLGACRVSEAGLRHVARLPNLRHLELRPQFLADDALRPLAALKQLTRLEISADRFSGRGLKALAAVPIETLVLSGCDDLTPAGLRVIAGLPRLEVLVLDWASEIDDEALGALSGARALRRLSLRGLSVRGTGLPDLPALRTIDLTGTWLSDAGLARVAAALPGLESLTALSFDRDDFEGPSPQAALAFSDRGVRALAGLARLHTVRLEYPERESPEGGCGALASRPLIELEVHSEDPLPDAVVARLARCLTLERLDVKLTGAQVGALAGLPRLTRIALPGKMTPAELAPLARAKRLETLSVNGSALDPTNLAWIVSLDSLVSLEIRYWSAPPTQLTRLAALQGLRRLELFAAPHLNDAVLTTLARGLRQLEHLELLACKALTDVGVAALAGHPCLRRLRLCILPKLTDAVLPSLATLPVLEHLELSYTGLRGATLSTLSRLPALSALSLRGTRLDGARLAGLAQLTRLTSLDLCGTHVDGRTVPRPPFAAVDLGRNERREPEAIGIGGG